MQTDIHYDPLTGLPNRGLFLDRLGQEMKHARRSGRPLASLFMNLDGFRKVNDSLGNDAGDLVLCDVAGRLRGCVREDDTVARVGGDEFTVILTGAERRRNVELVAQTIIGAFATPFDTARQPVQISVSIGIAFYSQDASSPLTLLQAANQAMHSAKASGSNRMFFYDTSEKTNENLF